MISAMTITTAMTPVAAPALNMPSIAAQLCKLITKIINKALNKDLVFIKVSFSIPGEWFISKVTIRLLFFVITNSKNIIQK